MIQGSHNKYFEIIIQKNRRYFHSKEDNIYNKITKCNLIKNKF